MAKHLIVDFNLFDGDQSIYLVEDSGKVLSQSSKPVDLIPEELTYLMNQNEDIQSVDLRGYESYLKEFILMVKYLINDVTTYRVATVKEVEDLHQELLADPTFELTAFSYTTKYIKVKGEIVDEYQVVKAKKVFNNEKEPDRSIDVKYEVTF